MGSKRSSKNPSNSRSSPPPSDPPVYINPPNPKNSRLITPSTSHKKQKLSSPISDNSNSLSPSPSTHTETLTLNTNRKAMPPDLSTTHFRWSEADTLKLLKSVISLRSKSGSSLNASNISSLLKEIKDWAPGQLSEKNIDSKLRHLRFKFHKEPNPGPDSSDFDRIFHELASKVWGPKSPEIKKEKGEKKRVDEENEDEDLVEEEEKDSDHDEKEEKNMVSENGDELFVDGDIGLLDGKETEHSYKYLRLALEEYWRDSKLNMNTLYAALPKVNPVQAKRLDEKFREVFVGMLKLKMDKNKVSNEIIHASLGC